MNEAELGIVLLCVVMAGPFVAGCIIGARAGSVAARAGWAVALVPGFVLRAFDKVKSFVREITE